MKRLLVLYYFLPKEALKRVNSVNYEKLVMLVSIEFFKKYLLFFHLYSRLYIVLCDHLKLFKVLEYLLICSFC